MIIDFEYLCGINEYVCEMSNEQSLIINKGNLLSALGTQQWYDDTTLQASAIIRSLVIGHGFLDGNKRTAAIAGAAIQDYNCSESEMIQCILAIATGELKDVEEIASILYGSI